MSAIDKGLLLHRAAMRAHVSEADERKAELQTAVDDMARALGKLLEAGVSRDFIDDTLCGLHDAACNADHPHNQTLDRAGKSFAWIDLDEVNALLAKVRR